MALRAGYYGFKRRVLDVIAALPERVSNQFNLTGARNINGTTYTSGTTNGVTWTVNDDGSVKADTAGESSTAVSQRGSGFVAPFTAQVIVSGCDSGGSGVHLYPFDVTNNARPYKDSSKSERLPSTANIYKGDELSFYMEKGNTYAIYLRVSNNVKVNNFVYYPLLRLATDPDRSYVPYAKTNKQLTDSIAADDATLSDHKTTINAIISAATGAADFTAFKTAMAALTPLTRSAAPEERSLELEEEEPVVVKKTTTRKKTTKTEEEE